MKIALRILFSPLTFLRLILVIVVTFLLTQLLIIEDLLTQKKGRYRFIMMRAWGYSMLFILGYIVSKNRRPKLPVFILMPNHQSYIDIFLMSALSPSAFIAKAEMKAWPIIGTALKHCKAILVDRESLKSMLSTMEALTVSLQNNISATLFPEGTTTHGPGTKSFKSGSFKVAADMNIPVIPCAIRYYDRGDTWVGKDPFIRHFFRQMWKPLSFVRVRFGNPLISTDKDELMKDTKNVIDRMMNKL